jgi:formate hydrogenlyase transcriptional activator
VFSGDFAIRTVATLTGFPAVKGRCPSRDLAQMVAERTFRSDLYYRLKVFPITLPPLRERFEDIPLLVRHFTERHAHRCKKAITTIPVETMTALCAYSWPGNVREMENFIERSVILSPGPTLIAPRGELKPASGNAAAGATRRWKVSRGSTCSGC